MSYKPLLSKLYLQVIFYRDYNISFHIYQPYVQYGYVH